MKVYLIGTPIFHGDAFLDFVNSHARADNIGEPTNGSWQRSESATHAEELVEAAGRICYMSFGFRQSPRTNFEYIGRLIQLGHESVLEHVNWTFLITGVSRALTHQLVRHRVGFAFSQLSQQYHEERNPEFIEPGLSEQFPEVHKTWQHAMAVAKEAYSKILDELNDVDGNSITEMNGKEIQRAVRSAARSVLPNATATTMMTTVNGRALRHFLKVRGSIPGDDEMRRLAAELLTIVKKEAAAIVSDFDLTTLDDGSPLVVHRPRKESIDDRPA